MKYGVQLGGGASVSQRDSLKKLAAAAEELGFDSVLIGDHIVIPKKINILFLIGHNHIEIKFLLFF